MNGNNTVKLLYVDTSGAHLATRTSIVVIIFSNFRNPRLSLSLFIFSSFPFSAFFAFCILPQISIFWLLRLPFISTFVKLILDALKKHPKIRKWLPTSWDISLSSLPFLYVLLFYSGETITTTSKASKKLWDFSNTWWRYSFLHNIRNVTVNSVLEHTKSWYGSRIPNVYGILNDIPQNSAITIFNSLEGRNSILISSVTSILKP